MKLKIILLFVVWGLLTSSAWAIGHLGPPTAELNKGQWSIGFNYSYSEQDLDDIKATVTEILDGVITPPYKANFESRDFKSNRYYGRLSYGLEDWWEIYGQLGAADLEGDTREEGDVAWTSYDFDTDFAWGWGTKITFAKQDKIDWGVTVQMNWLDTSSSKNYTGPDPNTVGKVSANIDAWDLIVAVGPTIDMGGWKLYGGPFYYMLDGDFDMKDEGTSDAGAFINRLKGDLEEDSNFGGYVGVEIPIANNWDFTAEGSATGDGWGLGVGIAVKF